MGLFRCKRCLYPNTKPDLHFDLDGYCSACRAFDRRAAIDWKAKEQEFLQLVEQNRGTSHDVIVACSGGKDSTWQIIKCLELGLKPLAVTATTDHLSALGRRNLDNISRLCDHVEITPHRPTRNRIAKFALEEIGDISWCEHQLIWSVPAREAIQRKIPIVLYGECPQNEYGAGPKGSETQTHLTHKWVNEFGGLIGLRVADMQDILGIGDRQLEVYRYPQNAGYVQALFMGAYFPWDGYQNFLTAKDHGFTPYGGDVEGSLYSYENLDNLQTGIHDRLRWFKFGYSRACDIASNHIRRGRLTRDQAIELVMYRESRPFGAYLGVPLEDILAPLYMTVAEFDRVCERFTNKRIVEWALSAESFRQFSGTTAEHVRAASGTNRAA